MTIPAPDPKFLELAARFTERLHVEIPSSALFHAAVALILRMGNNGVEVLFIERAAHDGDPWSGDLGFPGGKIEPGDDGPRAAAERETWEELALNLGEAHYLGRLDDIAGANLPVRVSCFVYGLTAEQPLTLSGEVRDAFWVSLADLCNPLRHVAAMVNFDGKSFQRPAIVLPAEGKPVLWGITYRLTLQFLEVAAGDDCPQVVGGSMEFDGEP